MTLFRFRAVGAAFASTALLPLSACAMHPAAPAAYSATRPSAAFHFEYGWPAEASAIPDLVSRLNRAMENSFALARGEAEEDRRARSADGAPFNPHRFVQRWTLGGNSARLLSLESHVDRFAGGAHGSIDVETLLYDRQSRRPVAFAELFAAGRVPERLSQKGCAALDRLRAERRGAPRPADAASDEFWACPAWSSLDAVPVDRDGDRRFDAIRIVAAPYVAGPWAEGVYAVSVEMDADLVAAIDSAYRENFSAR